MATWEVTLIVAVVGVASAAGGIILGEILRHGGERASWLRDRRLAAYADVNQYATKAFSLSVECLQSHGQAVGERYEAMAEAVLTFDRACGTADMLADASTRVVMERLFNAIKRLGHAAVDLDSLGDDSSGTLIEAARDAHVKFREAARAQFGV